MLESVSFPPPVFVDPTAPISCLFHRVKSLGIFECRCELFIRTVHCLLCHMLQLLFYRTHITCFIAIKKAKAFSSSSNLCKPAHISSRGRTPKLQSCFVLKNFSTTDRSVSRAHPHTWDWSWSGESWKARIGKLTDHSSSIWFAPFSFHSQPALWLRSEGQLRTELVHLVRLSDIIALFTSSFPVLRCPFILSIATWLIVFVFNFTNYIWR